MATGKSQYHCYKKLRAWKYGIAMKKSFGTVHFIQNDER